MRRMYFSDGINMPIRESGVIVYKLTHHAVEMKKINDVRQISKLQVRSNIFFLDCVLQQNRSSGNKRKCCGTST